MFKFKNNTNRTIRNSVHTGARYRQVTFNEDIRKNSFVCTPDDIKRVIVHVSQTLEERENYVITRSTKSAVYRSLVGRGPFRTTDEALVLVVRNKLLGGM